MVHQWPSAPNRLDECSIGRLRHNFNGRITSLPSEGENGKQRESCNKVVGPRIQLPLPIPGHLPGIGERIEIRNGPLVAVRAPGADQVCGEVQMKTQQDKHSREPSARSDHPSQHDQNEAEGQVMTDDMMISGIPQERMFRPRGKHFRNHPDAIKVGSDRGERNDAS